MKKLAVLASLIFCSMAWGQYNPSVQYVNTTPSGSCSAKALPVKVASTGALCTCPSGTYVCTSSGGGGGNTLTSSTGSPAATECVMLSADSSAATGCGASTGITATTVCSVLHTSGATPSAFARCGYPGYPDIYLFYSGPAAFGSESYGVGSINAYEGMLTYLQLNGGTAMNGNQGNGTLVQHSTGSTVSGDLAVFDANGNVIDGGGGGSGNLSGTLTPNVMPIATGTNTLGDGPIDDGVSQPGYLTIKPLAGDTNGLIITTTALGALAPADTSLELLGGAGVALENNPSVSLGSSLVIFNGDTGGTEIQDGGGGGLVLSATNGANFIVLENSGSGGTQIGDYGGGGITIDPSSGVVTIFGPIVPGTIYSAAGTPLPTCTSGLNGALATVADATTVAWGDTYLASGLLPAAVYCDGTLWSVYAK